MCFKAQYKWQHDLYEVSFPGYTHSSRANCHFLYVSAMSTTYFYCSIDHTVLQRFNDMSIPAQMLHDTLLLKGRGCVLFIFILPRPNTVSGPQ